MERILDPQSVAVVETGGSRNLAIENIKKRQYQQ
jgi:hypothetical protein